MKTKSNLYKLKMRSKLYTVMCNRFAMINSVVVLSRPHSSIAFHLKF